MAYIDGTANGELEKLRSAFHPNFNLYTVDNEDQLVIRSGEKYITNFKEGQKANRLGRILSIDYEGNTAIAKAEVIVPNWRVFTDYFMLLKYQDNWKIVQKSYSSKEYTDRDKITGSNRHLDTLFSAFQNDHPAVAAMAIHKGEVVYQNAFGYAHLENKLPATVANKFELSNLSRQFTAFAIFLLEDRGTIKLSDDIRQHLPDLPEYEQPITINHLLTMTSGLPDFWDIIELKGMDEKNVIAQEEVLKLITQLTPIFKPGEKYIYGNTDQVLLAEIISNVSDTSFSAFMQKELFTPLEMNNTVARESHNQLISNLAKSYQSTDAGFLSSPINFEMAGPINIYSSIEDLAKWELNLLDPKIGTKEIVDKMYTSCTTNDGNTMDSDYGQFNYGQQFFYWGHGVKETYQMGNLGGYASAVFKFPEQEFTVIVLSSGIPYSGYLGMQIADQFIGESFHETEPMDFSQLKSKRLKAKKLNELTGYYWNEESHFSRRILVDNDTLRYARIDGRSTALIPITENVFQMMFPIPEKVIVTFEETKEGKRMKFQAGDRSPLLFQEREKVPPPIDVLTSLTGKYYCNLLNITYKLKTEDGQLVIEHPIYGDIPLTPAMRNVFEGNRWTIGSLYINTNKDGFTLKKEHVGELKFERVSPTG